MIEEKKRKELIQKIWDDTAPYEFSEADKVVVQDMLWKLSLLIEQVSASQDLDSIELGSASKGGKVKIYGDFNDLDRFKQKIDKASQALAYATNIILTR